MTGIRLWANDGFGSIINDYHDPGVAAPWRNPDDTQTDHGSTTPFTITWEDSTFHLEAFWISVTVAGPDNGQGTGLLGAYDSFPIRCSAGSTISFHINGSQGGCVVSGGSGVAVAFETVNETNPASGALFSVTVVCAFGASDPLSFSLSGRDITIHLGTDAGGTPNSTPHDIATAWPYGSDVTATAFGSGPIPPTAIQYMPGDHTATYTLTAADHSWALMHNNFYPGSSPPMGQMINVKIKRINSGSPYYNISDQFRTQYPPSDDEIRDYAGALALATVQWPATSGWPFSAPTTLGKDGMNTVPATKKAGQKFSFTCTFVDPRGGPASLGFFVFAETAGTADPFPSFSPGTVTGGGGSFTATDVQIFDVGVFSFVGYNPFGKIVITPAAPAALVVAVPPAPTIYSSGPCTSLGGPQVPIRGTRSDGSVDVAVGTSQAIVVQLFDQYGNFCYDAAALAVTVAVEDPSSPPIFPTLSGTLTVSAVNGVALFKDLRVSGLSKTARLRFSAAGLTSVTQDVKPAVLGAASIQATARVGDLVTVTYTLQDYRGNPLLPASPDLVTVTDGTKPGGFAPTSSTATPVLGVATFVGTFGSPGTFNLRLKGSEASYLDPGIYTSDIVVSP